MADFTKLNGYTVKDPQAVHTYDTVADLKADTKLKAGNHAKTKGYYTANDGGSSEYIIREVTNDDVVDEMFIISLPGLNTLIGELVATDTLHSKQLGLKGDGTTDETDKLNALFENSIEYNKVVIDHGVYKITNTIFIKGLWRQDSGNNGQKHITFDNATLLYDGSENEASVVLYNMFKYDVGGLCIARNSVANYVQIVGCWHLNYHDWDIQDLHIDNEITNLDGKTYQTRACMYIAGNAIYVKGILTLGATSGSFNNVISFYNSIFNGTDKTTCVKLLGNTSKQNIQFISCDLSYATTSVYDVDVEQIGGCSITAIGCYYDSGIKIFSNNDKKGVLYTCISSLSAANTNQEKQNLLFTDYNKNGVISNNSPFGNNLPLSNINYAINGDLSYNTGSQSGNYGYIMGSSSSDWSKSYVDDIKAVNGKARELTLNNGGNKGFNVGAVTAPRTDKYCAFIHMQVVEGTFDNLTFGFRGQYLTINANDIGNNEVLIINNKGNVTVPAETNLEFGLTFNNASAGLKVRFFEVGVTAGNTYIPNMPLDSRAKIAVTE